MNIENMSAKQKLYALQTALKNNRGTGFTSMVRKAVTGTTAKVIAGPGADIPEENRTDWDTIHLDLLDKKQVVLIDNGKLQELVGSTLNCITSLERENAELREMVRVIGVSEVPQLTRQPLSDLIGGTNDLQPQGLKNKEIPMTEFYQMAFPPNYGPNLTGDDDMGYNNVQEAVMAH